MTTPTNPPEIITLNSYVDKMSIEDRSNINIQPDISSIINFQPTLLSWLDKRIIALKSLLGIEPI